ncbi:RluA family pseudouridine synthase [Reichenbachiella versicolor]|uniref:RluA family pseudouridine synthase n=1 Tax=Reichenbachiella versicolor TaxID=1821036 RepID=UPI000D6E0883|nr:RluA family pseudouridine synthase [Reichenbachiella versicolor]
MKRIDIKSLVVYEDDSFVAINKPPFVSTLEDRNDPYNILSLYKEQFGDGFVCHRLDKETSGTLLIAKTEEAYRHAALQFEDRSVQKVYHALVAGRFMDDVIKVDLPLKIGGSGKVRVDNRQGKEAETLFRTYQEFGHYTIVEAKPVTGRRHQIRVHLAYIEYPIVGDGQYGGEPVFLSSFKKKYKPSREREERPLFDRVALHAYSLEFKDLNGNTVKIESDYPKDIQMIIGKLEKYDR